VITFRGLTLQSPPDALGDIERSIIRKLGALSSAILAATLVLLDMIR
jgi:hypothetical protein